MPLTIVAGALASTDASAWLVMREVTFLPKTAVGPSPAAFVAVVDAAEASDWVGTGQFSSSWEKEGIATDGKSRMTGRYPLSICRKV